MSNTLQIRSQVWYYSIKLDTSWVARRAWLDIWSISNISGSTTATTKTKTSLDAQRIVLSNDTMKSPESNSKIVYRNHFHFFLDTLYIFKFTDSYVWPVEHSTEILLCPRKNESDFDTQFRSCFQGFSLYHLKEQFFAHTGMFLFLW